ncbi:MAG TPA: DUF4350 domain-containing protein [Terriglobia bacterium]|nr:DUF4350 domain-containing protein [Terriglobia bacterium]
MKEQLKKADLFGLLIIAAALVLRWLLAEWTVYQTVAVAAGALLVIISLVLKASEIRQGLGRRSTKFGIHSGVSVVALVGILGLLNYLGREHSKQVDLTEEKLYSLSDQSEQVVDQVKQDVVIKGFFQNGEDPRMRDILNLYTGRNKQIQAEFVDPEKHPEVAKQYDISSYGTLVLEMAGNKERIQKDRVVEEDITNALTKLIKGGKKTVYFIDGHGERGITDTGKEGYSVASERLRAESYDVKPLSLAREGKIPADATVVVMAGPASEPFPAEVDALNEYLKGGGSVLILVDPPDSASLKELARSWSIDVGDNMVIDRSLVSQLSGTNPVWALVQEYGPHKITEQFRNGYTLFPMARSVTPAKPAGEGITVETILSTSPDSWGETDIKSILPGKTVGMDKDKDVAGPVSLGVVATKDQGGEKKSRLVVIGDSDFASNAFFRQQLNGDLFANAISWLSHDESFISIRPKDPTNRDITMTESARRVLTLVSLIVFPGGILLAGVSVWASRRK